MKTKIILSLVLLLSLTAFSQPSKHTFSFDKQEFMLDGKPFQIISGEMHPARIPTEYWRHRIKMAKAMGCNTVAAYVFWNFHESDPGVFDFRTDRHNIAEFVRMVQEEGMWLILRPGPYVCAEWDFGGLPAYLLSIPDIKVRCMDPRYTQAAERYIRTLAMEIKPLLISEGGPILMVQIENEYGSYGNDRNYTSWLKEVWTRAGVSGPFYTADGATPYMLEAGTVAGAAIGLDPGTDDQNFAQATKVNPEVPSFCSELYPGWLTHWGESWQRPDTASLLKEVRWLMDHKKSFNFYVLTGGTNFGFWAGANTAGPNTYQPDVTSYDYDAPVNEMGQPTPKYLALRKLFESYLPKKQKLPAIPASPGVIALPEITLSRTASLWDALPAAQRSVQPKPMEMTGQKAGLILYRTHLI
ncbi:MAG: beta-galactosidase, partial [Marinilabiliales bacterium]|nr:beta-galactosidase [Marinilabiliales bacterium]